MYSASVDESAIVRWNREVHVIAPFAKERKNPVVERRSEGSVPQSESDEASSPKPVAPS